MKNYWLKDKIVAKGYYYWTYEIIALKLTSSEADVVVPETIVTIDEHPSMKIVEKMELEEDGQRIWKPVFMVWEKFEATFTDERFLEGHAQIRLLEVNGDAVGILRHYDPAGVHIESWVMHGLNLTDIDFPDKAVKAQFNFHHAQYS